MQIKKLLLIAIKDLRLLFRDSSALIFMLMAPFLRAMDFVPSVLATSRSDLRTCSREAGGKEGEFQLRRGARGRGAGEGRGAAPPCIPPGPEKATAGEEGGKAVGPRGLRHAFWWFQQQPHPKT